MTKSLTTALAAMLAALSLGPAAADGRDRNLWATINVCDTRAHPNRMGVRARMPGSGARERMYMRFTAQYLTRDGWKPVAGKSASGWLYAGSALFRYHELGYTFRFAAPRPATGFTLRGLVQFQYRSRSGRVVHRTHLFTERGHPSRGADPPGFSAARCRISTPKMEFDRAAAAGAGSTPVIAP